MRQVKHSIECWLLARTPQAEYVLLLAVAEQPGDHPRFFQPITGGVEPGETPHQACVREVAEETGVMLPQSQLACLARGYDAAITDSVTIHKRIFYAWIPLGPIRINPDEHSGYRWVALAEVDHLLWWQSNHETWRMLIDQRRLPGPLHE